MTTNASIHIDITETYLDNNIDNLELWVSHLFQSLIL